MNLVITIIIDAVVKLLVFSYANLVPDINYLISMEIFFIYTHSKGLVWSNPYIN